MASSDPSAQSEQFVREVFRRYYEKLSKLRLEILAAHLVTGDVINSDDHETIRAAMNTSDKSAIILRAIASHLDVDHVDTFTLLLDLMEQLGDVVMKKVAREINQQLNRSTRREANEVTGDQPKQKQQIDFSQYNADEAFSVLSATVYEIFISNNVQFEVLRRACIENINTPFGACIPKELVAKIQASDNLCKLFDVLALSVPYWNWINIRILAKMVRVSRVDEAKELVEGYKEAVFSRRLVLLLKDIPTFSIPPNYYTTVEKKWNRSLDEMTVKDLVSHWSQMEEIFNVKEPTLLLKKVVGGCVEIHWLVPAQLVHHICCAVFNSRHMLTSILHLKIGDHVILRNDDTDGYTDSSSDSVAKGDQSSLTQQLSSSHSIKPSMVVHVFNSLVEFIITQLSVSSTSLEHCLFQCKSLMASDAQGITLFTDVQLRELDKHANKMLLLQQLQPLWSWSDHSILEALASSCDEAVQVLTQFDDRLNSQLISAYPIPCVSPAITPSDDSPYTVLAVRCEQLIYQCRLQCMFDVRALLMKMCEITAHCLQLLAVRADPTILYWRVPKCVVSLVITKVLEYHKAIHDGMISEVCIHPFIRIATSSGEVLGPLVYLSPYVPPGDLIETPGVTVTERAELITKWLSKPENLFAVIDKLICDMKNKEDDMFQLSIGHRQTSRMFQHVRQQNSQLQGDVHALKRDVAEYRELYERKVKDYNEVLMKKEQQIKELEQQCPKIHSTSNMEVEDAIKKLQASLGEFRMCFEELSVHRVSIESSNKSMSEKQLDSKHFGDVTSMKLSQEVMERDDKLAEQKLKDSNDSICAKLNVISDEIADAKDWAIEMKRQTLELSKALKEKTREAEERNIKVKQLETEVVNVSKLQVEELQKEKKLLYKKVADLRTKPENIRFGSGRYGTTYRMNFEGTWCTAKMLHETLLKCSKSPEHLVGEVKERCSTLQHNNLVMFIGVTVVDKQPTIMTELMEVNLFTYIEQHGNLTLDTQVGLCKDMSRGLQELHKHSLLHRNLHGRNILIQDNRAKISDYYYPLLQVEGYTPDFTNTAAFVAPEVIEDQSNFSKSSDVFSLAVLFLVVITRKVSMIQEHVQNLAAVAHSHILLPLVQKCLSDQADSRPSAATICDEIKVAQDSPQYIGFKALKQTDSVPMFQAVKSGSKKLEWRTCATLPAPLVGANAVVLDNVIYVSGGDSPDEFASRYVFAYHFLENRWERLPPLNHTHGVPAVISNQLVIIGGKEFKGRKVTNQVSTYNQNEQKWELVYPNLGKERYAPLAVTYKHHVIVAGGKYHTLYVYDRLYDDIEVLDVQDTERLSWKRVPTRLPSKMWSPSVTISNDQLWIVGFNNDNSGSLNLIEQRSDEVFWIPVADIIATDKKGKWEALPRVMPYYSSTIVPYSNPVVTVGGDTRDARTTKALEIHDPVNNLWEQVAYLDGPSRAYVTVASIGEQQATVVLGGCTETKNKKSRNDSSLALVQIGYAV